MSEKKIDVTSQHKLKQANGYFKLFSHNMGLVIDLIAV